MNKFTNEQIAANEGLWDEYYNTSATDPFDSNTYAGRLAALNRDYPDEETVLSRAAAALGRKGRAVNSPAQVAASKANGRKGGRPRALAVTKDGKPRQLHLVSGGKSQYICAVIYPDGQTIHAKIQPTGIGIPELKQLAEANGFTLA